MNLDGLEKITIGDLKAVYAVNEMSIKEAIPQMNAFRDKHNLTDRQALSAFGVSKRIFDEQHR